MKSCVCIFRVKTKSSGGTKGIMGVGRGEEKQCGENGTKCAAYTIYSLRIFNI